MSTVRISVVKYINSLPYIYGIENCMHQLNASISYDTPADCYLKLKDGKCDLGLVPVVALKENKGFRLFMDYGLWTPGTVKSVILVSKTAIDNVREIQLDYQSKTSVELVKILCRDYWKIKPQFVEGIPGFENEDFSGSKAKLIIGDRAFSFYNQGYLITDLGEAWKKHTGLGFVFAAWMSNTNLTAGFREEFRKALDLGLENIDRIAEICPSSLSPAEIKTYLSKNIHYKLDVSARKGLNLFLEVLKKEKVKTY